MRIEILDEAPADLIEGFHFYEEQEAVFGWYFLDSLFSDIDSLLLYAGIHEMIHGYRRVPNFRLSHHPSSNNSRHTAAKAGA